MSDRPSVPALSIGASIPRQAAALFAATLCIAVAAEASDADLLVAARNGDPKLVEQLLAQGASVNAREQKPPNVGRTPLHYAAGGYNLPGPALHLEVARLLVEKGADVNAKAEGGYTPLHVSSGLRNASIVSFLLSK